MSEQDITAQLVEIRLAGSRCKELHAEYLVDKERAADTKKAWEQACDRLQELSCRWQDSEEVAARPLIAAVEAKAEATDPRILEEAFNALTADGGITEEEARIAIERVRHMPFKSAGAMLDAIYALPSSNGFDLVTSGLIKPKGKRRVATQNPA